MGVKVCIPGVLLLLLTTASASADGPMYIHMYWGKFSEESFRNITYKNWDIENEHLVCLGFGKEIWRHPNRNLSLELEGQVADHFGDKDDYLEVTGACNLRWHRFPWNHKLPTTFAFGGGLSCTSIVPDQEEITHDDSASLLCYLMYEIAFEIPRSQNWSFFFRVHHRSGVFGFMGDVDGASNYPSLGLRYTFSGI